MTILETIPLKPTNLTRQRPTDVMDMGLELRDNSIRYFLEFYADEIDSDDPVLQADPAQWKQAYTNVNIIASKKQIHGIELAFCDDADVWKVTLFISGFPAEMKIYFPTREGAQPVFDKLAQYVFDISNEQTINNGSTVSNG